MVDPDGVEHEPEQLAGGHSPRVQWTAVAVVAVLIAGAVLLARVAHNDARPAASHRETVPPVPAPTATGAKPSVHVGSVYLEHMFQCTRTDHEHRLSVALGVTNLGRHALVLLGATPVTSDSVLVQPTSARIGRGGCGRATVDAPVRLPPGGFAVVSLAFRVGPVCPHRASVSARLSFDGGTAGVVHADSSQLANLDRLDFVQCV